MKRILAIILCLCLMMAGCGGAGDEDQAASQKADQEGGEDGGVKIGLSFDSFVIERWIQDRDVFVSTAKELGASVNVQNANGNVKEQISQIQYLIDRDVDVLVVIAADCGALSEVMGRAKEAGIITVSYDRLIQDGGTDLYVSFNNEAVGTLMAKALKESIPQGGQIFMIQGAKEDHNVSLVKKGFEEEIQGSGLEVVYQANCQGWVAEQAVEYLGEALEAYPEVKGIMCGNDDIASQVVRVLTENRLAGKVQVVGQDGDLAACQRIVEGTQTMTAFKPVELLAKAAAKYAVALAKGEEPDRINASIDDGSQEVPFLMLQPISVTKKNMDEIIVDGGYHSQEEVYLNVTKK